MRYHFDLIGASKMGRNEHPQVEILKDFPDATDWQPESLGDCWFFHAEEHKGDLPACYLPCGDNGVPLWNYHRKAG
jgi:hypothetical protein